MGRFGPANRPFFSSKLPFPNPQCRVNGVPISQFLALANFGMKTVELFTLRLGFE